MSYPPFDNINNIMYLLAWRSMVLGMHPVVSFFLSVKRHLCFALHCKLVWSGWYL